MIIEMSGIKGKFRAIKTDSITGQVIETTPFYDNIVVIGTDTGKDLVLDRLNGNNTYSLNISHIDIGTSSTAPSVSDTALNAVTARTAKATGTISTNTLTLRFFFASADLANGTYWEVGTFIDGTSTVSTGRMFNHALFGSAYVKGTNEDTTLEVVFTIT